MSALHKVFKRLAAYGAITATMGLVTGCGTITPPTPEGCMGGTSLRLPLLGFSNRSFDDKCAVYEFKRLEKTAQLERVKALLRDPSDLLSYSLGIKLAGELPESAMDEKARVKPETIAKMLSSDIKYIRAAGTEALESAAPEVQERTYELLKKKQASTCQQVSVSTQNGIRLTYSCPEKPVPAAP